MAYPFSPRYSDKYVLIHPNGHRAVFNDPTDPFYVGMLSAVEGLESAEVRESADELVETDGGAHGNFWYGRRPVVLTGMIFGHATVAERDARIARLTAACNLMRPHPTRGEGGLMWLPNTATTINWWPNPGAEGGSQTLTNTNIQGFQAQPPRSSTMSIVTTPVFAGSRAFRWQSDAVTGGDQSFIPTNDSNKAYDYNTLLAESITNLGGGPQGVPFRFPVIPGTTYKVSARVRSAAVSRNTRVRIIYYTADGFVADNTTGSNVATTTSSWVNPTHTQVAPATAAWMSPAVEVLSVAAGGETHYFDELFAGPNVSYFDGSTAGNYWHGAPHTSQSGPAVPFWLPLRRASRLSITGGWAKQFQIPLVSSSAFIQSYAVQDLTSDVASSLVFTSKGTADTYPFIVVEATAGTINSVTVLNTEGSSFPINFTGSPPAFSGTDKLYIDTRSRNLWKTGTNAGNWNQYVNWTTTVWPRVVPNADSTFTTSFTSGANVRLRVVFRDAWV